MRISLCIVARNEAALLRDCIESARPIVDEVVVVDTGSSDATPEIATDSGARLIRAEWPHDLGRAHNLPIENARGDWILSLDADEVLDPTRRHRVREVVEAGGADGYRIAIRNYCYQPMPKWRPIDPSDPLARGALGYVPTCVVRLFRRRRTYRFSGFLHQSMDSAIRQHGGRIGEADVAIHHYGPLRSDRLKTGLYKALARKQVTARPRNPRAWLELGVQLLHDADGAPAALDAFRRARSLGPRSGAGFFMGWTLVETGQPTVAIPFLEEAIEVNPRDDLPDYDRADAWELLGIAREALGQRRRAGRAYRKAIETRPESPVALNNLAGLLAERGAVSEAERLLDRLLVRYRGLAMPWATLGTLRLRRGDRRGARRALETALGIDPLCRAARANLDTARERDGRRGTAARTGASAREPLDTPAARGPDVAAGRPSAPGISVRRSPGSVTVVSLIAHLHGGAGRVLVDAVHALRDARHVVLCGDAGAYTGLGLHAELAAAGVDTYTVASQDTVRRVLEQVRPDVVMHHWWNTSLFPGAVRTGTERWIAVGHATLPMPPGYDAYVVLSEFHGRLQAHLPPERLHRIANGVDLRRFSRRSGRSAPTVSIAMLSRLEPGKFPRRLLAYLPPLDDLGARLLVAGPGGRRYEIEPELARRGLARGVRFVGSIRSKRVPQFLSRADIGLHLTETHQEICSMTILEMLAAGLPIVAEPKGCLPELVTSGENGFLAVEEREIAARLEELVRSAGLRRRMGAASRRKARRYDIRRFRSSVRGLVSRLAEAPPPRRRRPAR